MRAGVALIALVIPVAMPAAAQAQQQLDQMFERCVVGDDKYTADQTISACTAQIEWGRSEPSRRVFALRAYHARAMAEATKGELDRAISDIDQAMQLESKPNPSLYGARGEVWRAKGELDRAVADFGEAIRLDPKAWGYYLYRGEAWFDKGDFDRAIADYDQAIAGAPGLSFLFYQFRGRANLYAGAFDNARADFVRARGPRLDGNAALWTDIVNKRSNMPSGLADAAKQIDMTKWPAPLIRLYLGEGTAEAVLAATDDPDRDTKKAQVCTANFFLGEFALRQGETEEAKRLFGLAAAACSTGWVENGAARAELKALLARR
jgi:lipoprotein NlpI